MCLFQNKEKLQAKVEELKVDIDKTDKLLAMVQQLRRELNDDTFAASTVQVAIKYRKKKLMKCFKLVKKLDKLESK